MGSKEVVAAALACLIAGSALASETGPVIVVPGRPGVPIMMYGQDVSGAVIEGDWGLARPSYIAPQVIFPFYAPVVIEPSARPYYPRNGRQPRYGRLERDTPRPPQPAPSYRRTWGVESDATPVTIPPPAYDVPPVVVTPDLGRRHRP